MATATLSPHRSRREACLKIAEALHAAAQALELLAEDVPEPDPLLEPGPALLTVEDVARHLRRSVSHVRELCRRRELVAMRDGQGWRIRRSELERYEARRMR